MLIPGPPGYAEFTRTRSIKLSLANSMLQIKPVSFAWLSESALRNRVRALGLRVQGF